MHEKRTCERCGIVMADSGGVSSVSPAGRVCWYHNNCARIVAYAKTIVQKLSAFTEVELPDLLAEVAFEMSILTGTKAALQTAKRRDRALSPFRRMYRNAFLFAARAHVDQRYGAAPYTDHLVDVARTIVEFGFSPYDPSHTRRARHQRLCIAGLLHDTIEDTNAGHEDIVEKFGQETADIVLAVTNEAGKNRKEKFSKTYPKIRGNPDAVIVKLADRISNGRSCQKQKKPGLFKMYQKEYGGFEEALRIPGECDSMWECLERIFGTGKYSGMIPDKE